MKLKLVPLVEVALGQLVCAPLEQKQLRPTTKTRRRRRTSHGCESVHLLRRPWEALLLWKDRTDFDSFSTVNHLISSATTAANFILAADTSEGLLGDTRHDHTRPTAEVSSYNSQRRTKGERDDWTVRVTVGGDVRSGKLSDWTIFLSVTTLHNCRSML